MPQTKRMKSKYTVEKCSLSAKLMREGGLGGQSTTKEEEEYGLEDDEEDKSEESSEEVV